MGEYGLWVQAGTALLALAVTGVVVPLARRLGQLKANELRHLQESVDRIEKKLDDHVRYHLERQL